MKEKTHWKKAFNKDFLGAWDLDEGKDLKLVIDYIEVKEVKNPQGTSEKRNIAIFKGDTKPMILNVTNCKLITKFANSKYIEDWKGISIQVYVKDDIKAFGDVVEGLRIRPQQPSMTKPELKPDSEAWNGAVNYLSKEGNSIEAIKKKYIISEANENKLMEEVMNTTHDPEA